MKNIDKIKDLTGQRFGKWTVISFCHDDKRPRRWLCRCDCGREGRVSSQNLKQGRSRSCGCVFACKDDLTGRRFGKWTVLRLSDKPYLKYTGKIWECRCDCGSINYAIPSILLKKKGGCRYCVVAKAKSYVGMKFGKRRVLGYIEKDNKWIVKCKCGNVSILGSCFKYTDHCKSCNEHNYTDGGKQYSATMTDSEAVAIRNLSQSGLYTRKELARMFDVKFASIHDLLGGRTFKQCIT